MLTKIILDVKIESMKKRFLSFFTSLIIFSFLILFLGCSLDYSNDTQEKIKAPEIGDGAELILRELTAGQHADFIDKLKDEEFRGSEKRLTAFMIMNCLVDENGNREIQDEEQAMAVMEKLPQRLIRRINVALAKLNNSDTEEKKR